LEYTVDIEIWSA